MEILKKIFDYYLGKDKVLKNLENNNNKKIEIIKTLIYLYKKNSNSKNILFINSLYNILFNNSLLNIYIYIYFF